LPLAELWVPTMPVLSPTKPPTSREVVVLPVTDPEAKLE